MCCTKILWLEADALYASEGRGFGEEDGRGEVFERFHSPIISLIL